MLLNQSTGHRALDPASGPGVRRGRDDAHAAMSRRARGSATGGVDAARSAGGTPAPSPDRLVVSPVGGLPTRFCPSCYARNVWEAAHCEACGAALDPQDDFATRLVWALAHPDTGVAVNAAATIAARHLTGAIGALRRTLESPEVYRVAAAAEALTAFLDDPEARAAIAEAQRHRSVVVRRAVLAAMSARGTQSMLSAREGEST